jgi:hypothetical protein
MTRLDQAPTEVDAPFTEVDEPFTEVDEPLTEVDEPLTEVDGVLTYRDVPRSQGDMFATSLDAGPTGLDVRRTSGKGATTVRAWRRTAQDAAPAPAASGFTHLHPEALDFRDNAVSHPRRIRHRIEGDA